MAGTLQLIAMAHFSKCGKTTALSDSTWMLELSSGICSNGYDWVKTRETIAQAVEEVQARAAKIRQDRQRLAIDDDDDESEIGDFLFQSIWIAVPPNRDEQELRRTYQSRNGRYHIGNLYSHYCCRVQVHQPSSSEKK